MNRGPQRNDRPRFDDRERQVLRFTGTAHLLTHFAELTWPTLAVALAAETGEPLERVLGWSLAGYLLFGLGALPAGVAADRFGERRVIILGLLLAAFSTFAAALAAPGWTLAACLAGMGLGVSAYHPAGIGLLSRSVSARGAALGINGIYGNIGIALAPLTTGALATWLGWRATLALTGLALLCGAALGWNTKMPPARASGVVAGQGSAIGSRRIAAFLVLCGSAMLGGFVYRGNTLSLPALFSERIDIVHFGLGASIAMLMGVFGQYVGGRVADRFPLGWTYVTFHVASLPMLFLMTVTTQLSLLACASVFAFFALGMQPIENSLFAQLTPERWRSTAYGLKFTLTFGIGSLAVVMVRWVAEWRGFVGVYQILIGVVAALISGALVLALVYSRIPAEPIALEKI